MGGSPPPQGLTVSLGSPKEAEEDNEVILESWCVFSKEYFIWEVIPGNTARDLGCSAIQLGMLLL